MSKHKCFKPRVVKQLSCQGATKGHTAMASSSAPNDAKHWPLIQTRFGQFAEAHQHVLEGTAPRNHDDVTETYNDA